MTPRRRRLALALGERSRPRESPRLSGPASAWRRRPKRRPERPPDGPFGPRRANARPWSASCGLAAAEPDEPVQPQSLGLSDQDDVAEAGSRARNRDGLTLAESGLHADSRHAERNARELVQASPQDRLAFDGPGFVRLDRAGHVQRLAARGESPTASGADPFPPRAARSRCVKPNRERGTIAESRKERT